MILTSIVLDFDLIKPVMVDRVEGNDQFIIILPMGFAISLTAVREPTTPVGRNMYNVTYM